MTEPHDGPVGAHALASLYALGALSEPERAAFDEHLEVSHESVEQVMALLPVTHRLAYAVTPRQAPPALRDRVIAAVTGAPPATADGGAAPEPPAAGASAAPEPPAAGASAAPEPPAASAGAASEPPAAGAGAAPEPAMAGGTGAPGPAKTAADNVALQLPSGAWGKTAAAPERARSGRVLPWVIAAMALAAAAGLGWYAVQQMNLAQALQENLDAANVQATLADLESTAAQQVVAEARAHSAVLSAADVEMVHLSGQPAAPAASARLFRSRTAGMVFSASGLPALPPGRIYQLWFIPGSGPVGAALLRVDEQGRVTTAVTVPDGVAGQVPAAVTIEPEGGATAPSGEVYLLGRP